MPKHETAVSVRHLRKTFRIFSERNQTLKQAVIRRRRAVYEEFVAVDDVSFDIPVGSTFGIIGPNGSGKSTTLKVLARILEPDGGSVETHGRVSALLELGAGFHPELTGRENVYLNAAILGIPRKKIDRAFDEIIGFADLGQFIENPVKTYSSGMYARLGFAVAVNVDPDILIIDEVLAVGDELFQRRCAEKIDDLKKDGRTVILVSHGMGSIQLLCDQVAWVEKGRLRQIGPPKNVIAEYLKSAHPDVSVDPHGVTHVGSGQARLDSAVATVDGFTLEPMLTLQFNWTCTSVIPQAVINVVIKRTDGTRITSLTSRRADPTGFTIESGQGSRTVSSKFPVVPGTYEIDAEITDFSGAHVIDRAIGIQRFDVKIDVPMGVGDGFLIVPEEWSR